MNHELIRPFFAQNRRHRMAKTLEPQIFFTPLFITTYAISPQKKSPEFRAKAQVALNMKGVVLPLRTYDVAWGLPHGD